MILCFIRNFYHLTLKYLFSFCNAEQIGDNKRIISTNLPEIMVEIDKLEDILVTLNKSGVILYPTDTIWGIGCNACDEHAIQKIYDLKKRDISKKFIILVSDMAMLEQYVDHIHPKIDTLLSFHKRPLTVVYDKAKNLPDILVGEDGSIAVRVVKDEFCAELIANFGKPLVATSANISNEPFPVNFGNISSAVISGVDFVVKRRQFEKNESAPSVMVKMSPKGELVFLRE